MNNFDMPTQLDVINFHNTHDTLCVPKGMTLKQLVEDYDRLNNIINRIDNFVDRTIEVIKHQPSGNDEWILERLNGIKYLTELKENK